MCPLPPHLLLSMPFRELFLFKNYLLQGFMSVYSVKHLCSSGIDSEKSALVVCKNLQRKKTTIRDESDRFYHI